MRLARVLSKAKLTRCSANSVKRASMMRPGRDGGAIRVEPCQTWGDRVGVHKLPHTERDAQQARRRGALARTIRAGKHDNAGRFVGGHRASVVRES